MSNNAYTKQASGNDIPSDGGLVQESIVIPAYRGRSTIGECIESLLVAAGGRQVEILVVESSQDGTVEWVRGTYPQVRVIASQSQLSAGGARNRGVEESEGGADAETIRSEGDLFCYNEDSLEWLRGLTGKRSLRGGPGEVAEAMGWLRNHPSIQGLTAVLGEVMRNKFATFAS